MEIDDNFIDEILRENMYLKQMNKISKEIEEKQTKLIEWLEKRINLYEEKDKLQKEKDRIQESFIDPFYRELMNVSKKPYS